MNYLSHYYFDRENADDREVLGAVLPDMIRSFNKSWTLKTEQNEEKIRSLPGGISYLKGWNKHKAIDKIFHSRDSFSRETAAIKQRLKPIIIGSPVWAFFLAHIFYELNLDAVLLRKKSIDASRFYAQLASANKEELLLFLKASEIEHPETFLPWLNHFLETKFLLSYKEDANIAFALDRICYRLWKSSFTEGQKSGLAEFCAIYRLHLAEIYPEILHEVLAGLL